MAMLWQQTDTDTIDFYVQFFFNLRDIFMNNVLLCYFKNKKRKSDVIFMIMIITIFGTEVLIGTYSSDQNGGSIFRGVSFLEYFHAKTCV